MTTIKASVIGAAGYTGGELIRLLVQHPQVQLVSLVSSSSAGQPVTSVHTDLYGLGSGLTFAATLDQVGTDVVFLCLPHGKAASWLADNPLPDHIRVVDLSNDHRLDLASHGFVYGLPEAYRTQIRQASRVANPGCFATAIQLGLLPLAGAGLLPVAVNVSAITGSTGAGQSLSETTHYTWRSQNMSVYKAFRHQHLGEIHQTLADRGRGWAGTIDFLPFRGNFTRGILAAIWCQTNMPAAAAKALYQSFYLEEPFVYVVEGELDVKMAAQTNNCLISVEVIDGRLLVTTAIDNLLKGASGQAVQNMNLMFGLPEGTGLGLKPGAY